jgi:hypothetical protein
MEFSPDGAAVSKADLRFSLHLAPSSAAVLFFEPWKFPDAFADGDGLNVRNLFQYIKGLGGQSLVSPTIPRNL